MLLLCSNDPTDHVQALCNEVEALEVEQATFRRLFDELSEAKEQLKHISAKYEELQGPLQYDDSKQKALFEKCMGLEFRLTEDRAISLVFRNLSPQDPEQRCVITMDVSEQNQWAVVSIEPHVSGVRALLNDLNKTGNFSQFCKAVRSKFKQHCAAVAA